MSELSETKIKELTGGDKIYARSLFLNANSAIYEKADLDRYIVAFAEHRENVANLRIDLTNAYYSGNSDIIDRVQKLYKSACKQRECECPGHTFCNETNNCVICNIGYYTWVQFYCDK